MSLFICTNFHSQLIEKFELFSSLFLVFSACSSITFFPSSEVILLFFLLSFPYSFHSFLSLLFLFSSKYCLSSFLILCTDCLSLNDAPLIYQFSQNDSLISILMILKFQVMNSGSYPSRPQLYRYNFSYFYLLNGFSFEDIKLSFYFSFSTGCLFFLRKDYLALCYHEIYSYSYAQIRIF